MPRTDFLTLLAESSAALLQDYDLAGMLIQSIDEAVAVTGAADGGLLVVTTSGELELLSATSHSATALETYQAFSGEGPCRACMEAQVPLGFSRAEAGLRWPTVGMLMASLDYEFVLAAPLRWRGSTLGGLNLFWTASPADDAATKAEAQVFADLQALFIINSEPITPDAARQRVAAALQARGIVEQAKGVLSEVEGIDLAEAYVRLLQIARDFGRNLTDAAQDVVRTAHMGRGSDGSAGHR